MMNDFDKFAEWKKSDEYQTLQLIIDGFMERLAEKEKVLNFEERGRFLTIERGKIVMMTPYNYQRR
jgi:hypothetical protein